MVWFNDSKLIKGTMPTVSANHTASTPFLVGGDEEEVFQPVQPSGEIEIKYKKEIDEHTEKVKPTNVDGPESLQELRTRKDAAQARVETCQANYNNVVNQQETKIAKARADMEAAQKDYLDAVNNSDCPEIVEIKAEIEANEKSLTETKQCIQDYDVHIEKTNTDILNITNQLESTNKKIEAYNGLISNLSTKLVNTTNSDTKNATQAQIKLIAVKLGQENANKVSLELLQEKLKQKKDDFINEKNKAENNLNIFNAKKQELDNRVNQAADRRVTYTLYIYTLSRSLYQRLEDDNKKNIQEAATELQTARDDLERINRLICEEEAKIIREQEAEITKKIDADAEAARQQMESNSSGSHSNNSSASISRQTAETVQIADLQKSVDAAKQELSTKENELFSICINQNQEINNLKTIKNKNFNKFCDELSSTGDTELVSALKVKKDEVDDLERVYFTKRHEVAQLESKIGLGLSTNEILEQQIAALESSQAELNSADKSSFNEEQTIDYNEKITNLTRELSSLKQQKQDTENLINDNQKLKTLKEEEALAKSNYEKAKKELDDKMQEAANKYSQNTQISNELKAYQKSDTDYNNTVESKISSLNSEIITLRTKVQNLSQTLGAAQNKDLKSKYRLKGDGDSIVEFAKSFLGKNENDGSADIFWQGIGKNWSSKSYPWCAAFVSYILTHKGIDMTGAHKGSVSGLRKWGASNNKYITGSQAQSVGIKPGDVVIWEGGYYSGHTGIVSKVYPDGTYDTIEGNYSNKVCELKGKGQTGHYKISRTTGFIKIT